jgi:hypothetical protein
MLLLLSNPRIGLSLALEAGISAGESTEFIDVDGERAVRFRDDPIISHASNMACDRVSANVLDGRFAKKANRGKHDFAFSGLIKCAMRLRVVGEIKKQRYVYYHCIGYWDKCRGNPASCRRKYVREEALEARFTELLSRLNFDDEVLEWVREALHASHADERCEHEESITASRSVS